ncbi:hypothetical protein [Spirosoma foliorum]|uniref:Uncharacterized protein n=1 Tax=Spirosoma foliorum TaxID=2710596 RepID=A0A7G5GQE9_9BACT|nr:hypothetical protein [Spirosoma foliorum]QMW01091.1 hypothetical protein H3H32_24375 [Spirosoma foliorum]
MIKEPKHIDFYTSGRQLSKEDFALISQWIATDKKKRARNPTKGLQKQEKNLAHGDSIATPE